MQSIVLLSILLSYSVEAFSSLKNAFGSRKGFVSISMMASSGTTGTIFTASKIHVFSTAEQVSDAVCVDFVACISNAINTKGACYCAIPGGSALKMLTSIENSDLVDWSKVFIFYVSQKCTSPTDPSATHFKAKSIFLDSVGEGTINYRFGTRCNIYLFLRYSSRKCVSGFKN